MTTLSAAVGFAAGMAAAWWWLSSARDAAIEDRDDALTALHAARCLP